MAADTLSGQNPEVDTTCRATVTDVDPISQPVLNTPYEKPTKYWELGIDKVCPGFGLPRVSRDHRS